MRGVHSEDISYFVKKVVFRLHPTFRDHTREVEASPFEIQERGWGEFDIRVQVHFVDPAEKTVTIKHKLKLFGEGNLVQKRPIVSEQYDEVVFVEPTVLFLVKR